MSEEWRSYFSEVDGQMCSVFVDVGLIRHIDELPTDLVKIFVSLKEPNDAGFPVGTEFEALNAIEDDIDPFACQHGSRLVGRFTLAGNRIFLIYTSAPNSLWESYVAALAQRTRYAMSVEFESDPGHSAYREDLYPSPNEWQAIKDMDVIMQLRKHGDDGSAPRRVDHWIYFPGKAVSADFVIWAESNGFTELEIDSGYRDDGRYGVRLFHEISLDDISDYTIALRQKAAECEGDYDGWETIVIKPN